MRDSRSRVCGAEQRGAVARFSPWGRLIAQHGPTHPATGSLVLRCPSHRVPGCAAKMISSSTPSQGRRKCQDKRRSPSQPPVGPSLPFPSGTLFPCPVSLCCPGCPPSFPHRKTGGARSDLLPPWPPTKLSPESSPPAGARCNGSLGLP